MLLFIIYIIKGFAAGNEFCIEDVSAIVQDDCHYTPKVYCKLGSALISQGQRT